MTKTQTTADASAMMAEVMKTMQDTGFMSVPTFGTDWLETIAKMQNEVLSFTAARIKHDMETQAELLKASGISEIQQIQTQYLQKVMDDYAAQSRKLQEMGQGFTPKAHEKHATPV